MRMLIELQLSSSNDCLVEGKSWGSKKEIIGVSGCSGVVVVVVIIHVQQTTYHCSFHDLCAG